MALIINPKKNQIQDRLSIDELFHRSINYKVFGSESYWRKKFNRSVKLDARPYVILAPKCNLFKVLLKGFDIRSLNN